MVFVNVVGHIVQDHVHLLFMCAFSQGLQRALGAKPPVHLGAAHGPIAVVPAEFAGDIGAGAVLPQSPSPFCILGHGRDPHRVQPQILKVAGAQALLHALQIAALVVGFRPDGCILDRFVVAWLAVDKPVHHQEIHGGGVPVGPVQLADFCDHFIAFDRKEEVLGNAPVVGSPRPEVPTSHGVSFKRQGEHDSVVVVPEMDHVVVDHHKQRGRTVRRQEHLGTLALCTECWRHRGVNHQGRILSAHAVGHGGGVVGVELPFAIDHPLVRVASRQKHEVVGPSSVLLELGVLGGPSCGVAHELHVMGKLVFHGHKHRLHGAFALAEDRHVK